MELAELALLQVSPSNIPVFMMSPTAFVDTDKLDLHVQLTACTETKRRYEPSYLPHSILTDLLHSRSKLSCQDENKSFTLAQESPCAVAQSRFERTGRQDKL